MNEQTLTDLIYPNLPEIDGVVWRVWLAGKPSGEYFVYISSRFEVDPSNGESLEYIFQKVNQITSGGQVKLELESYYKPRS